MMFQSRKEVDRERVDLDDEEMTSEALCFSLSSLAIRAHP